MEYFETVIESGVLKRCKLTNLFYEECGHPREIVLPEGIKRIGCRVFADRHFRYIKSITIPEGVKSIGEQAFVGCSSIESIVIPDSVKIIEEEAFCGCQQLSDIIWGKGLEIIEKSAFAETSIEKIIIPESVKEIQEYAFYNCRNLCELQIFPQTKAAENAFDGCGRLPLNAEYYLKKVSDAEQLYKDNTFKLLQALYGICHEGFISAAKEISNILRNNSVIQNPKWPLYEDYYLSCVKELFEGGDSGAIDNVIYLLKEDSRTKNSELANKMEEFKNFTPLTTDEVLSEVYGTYNKDKIRIIDIILSKINEDNREKAKILINDWEQDRFTHSDIYDLENCFATAEKIEYFEFNSKEEAKTYFSKQKEVINLFLVISKNTDEITMDEVGDICNSVILNLQSEDCGLDNFLWDAFYKENASLIRLLVQFSTET